MSIILETNRLILREFTFSDAEFIIELLNSPSWLQYIGERNVKTIDDANEYLKSGSLKSYKENGFGFYAVIYKSSLKPIGLCGLTKRPNLPNPDIGFAFLPDKTSKGYGYEAASAVLDYAKNSLKINKIIAIVQPNNHKSIGLLRKIGLQQNGLIDSYPDEPALILFEISLNNIHI